MTDAARTLLVACALSAIAATMFVLRLRRTDANTPPRRIGELRAAHAAALVVAATGASTIGFAIVNASAVTAALELAGAFLFIGAAGVMLLRDPREALLIGAIALLVHAGVDLSHRPGWLSTDLMPRWYLIGCAAYDAFIAALCLWARRT